MSTLENKAWFRLLKVIYVGAFIFAMVGYLGALWIAYEPYVSDYEVKNSPEYVAQNSDGVVGRLTEGLIKKDMIKEEGRAVLRNKILLTPIVIFLVWLFFLVVRRIFFYIVCGEKFLRVPKRLFD